MKNNLLKYYVAATFFCPTLVMFATPGSGNDTNDLEGADTPTAAAIDNYLWLLALIGLTFIFFRLRSYNKQVNM